MVEVKNNPANYYRSGYSRRIGLIYPIRVDSLDVIDKFKQTEEVASLEIFTPEDVFYLCSSGGRNLWGGNYTISLLFNYLQAIDLCIQQKNPLSEFSRVLCRFEYFFYNRDNVPHMRYGKYRREREEERIPSNH